MALVYHLVTSLSLALSHAGHASYRQAQQSQAMLRRHSAEARMHELHS